MKQLNSRPESFVLRKVESGKHKRGGKKIKQFEVLSFFCTAAWGKTKQIQKRDRHFYIDLHSFFFYFYPATLDYCENNVSHESNYPNWNGNSGRSQRVKT